MKFSCLHRSWRNQDQETQVEGAGRRDLVLLPHSTVVLERARAEVLTQTVGPFLLPERSVSGRVSAKVVSSSRLSGHLGPELAMRLCPWSQCPSLGSKHPTPCQPIASLQETEPLGNGPPKYSKYPARTAWSVPAGQEPVPTLLSLLTAVPVPPPSPSLGRL